MAVTNFSPLLGLALPTTGDLQGTWGTTVNDSITGLIDSAVAGTTTLSADADVTLSTTNGAANQARNAIIRWTATGTTTRNITAPAQSKAYLVINATGGTQSIVIRGAGPTTGVTVAAGTRVLVAWSGSDFVTIASGSTFSELITVTGTASTAGGVALGEDSDNGVNTATVKAPAAITSNYTMTLPQTDGATLGYLNIPQSGAAKTTSYALVTTDIGKVIEVGTGGSITVPNSTFAAGDAVIIFNNTSGSIAMTMTITNAYIAGTDADKATINVATRGVANILFVTGTTCVVTGNVS
jgi:hypothetical protein